MIYLDNSATTPVNDEVAKVVYEALTKEFGNPSSLHGYGVKAEKKINEVRALMKKILGIDQGKIIFTSGGTEANNLAIFGAARRNKRKKHLITTVVEHPSVLEVFSQLEREGYQVTYLPVDSKGKVSLEELKHSLCQETALVSIQYVNNEIGTIQPVEDIGEIIKTSNYNPVFHCDAVQGVLKLQVKPEQLGIDLLSFSGHKFHAPKGVGGLYIRDDRDIVPLIYGGGQEDNLRSGTENVPSILGLGKALEVVYKHYNAEQDLLLEKKKKLYEEISNHYHGASLIGPDINEGAPHILCLGFENFKGEVLIHALEEKGIYASTGSACASRKKDKSPVLEAIDLPAELQEGVVRFSLSYFNSMDEIKRAAKEVVNSAKELEDFIRG